MLSAKNRNFWKIADSATLGFGLKLGFAVLGLTVALSLALSPVLGVNPICSGRGDCASLSTSGAGHLLGIPTSWYGIVYYLTLVVLTLVSTRNRLFFLLSSLLVALGCLVSLVLLFTMRFRVGLLCELCLVSAFSCAGLAIVHSVCPWASLEKRKIIAVSRLVCVEFAVLASLSIVFARQPKSVINIDSLQSIASSTMVDQRRVFGGELLSSVVVVWTDHSCGVCHVVVPELLKVAKSKRGVGVCVRNAPLNDAANAGLMAQLSEAMRSRGKYEEFLSSIASLKSHDQESVMHLVSSLERSLHLSREEVDRSRRIVERDVELAQQMEINGTPIILECKVGGRCREIEFSHARQLLGGG